MRILAALLVLLAVDSMASADVRVTAAIDPAHLAAGESADLAVTVDGAQNAPTPEIANAAGLQIRYVGPATQISFVNGRASASITHHFTVLGAKAGRYAIGPISVDVDGKHYDAGSVTLEVAAAGAAAAGGGAGGAAATGGTSPSDELELGLTLPRTEVYLHERLPLSVKLLVGAIRVGDLQYPTVPGDGFALEKFPEPAQRREDTARGPRQAVEFKTTLTPLKAGTLTVGPANMGMSVVVQSRRRGGFFGGFFGDESRPVQLNSQPIALTVLPLPGEGRPADFSGAVGRFTFVASASPTDVATGDPVTVRSVVRGEGSLDGITPSTIAASDTLRVYPVQSSQAAEGGERTFEQVVIPLRDGSLSLPPLRFSYFDPTARAYRTVTTAPVALTVRPSAQAQAHPQIVGGTPSAVASPQRTETLGRDIVFIKDAPGTLRPIGARLHRSIGWWAVQVIPVALWAIAVMYAGRRRRLATDTRYARFTRAGREARAALARARQALDQGDTAGCHDQVAAAVRDYLAAKLALPPGSVVETAPVLLAADGAGATVATQVRSFFAASEAARFAPSGGSREALEHALTQADTIVRALERKRRAGPALAAVVILAVAASCIAAGEESPSALFFRANGLYGDERYPEAAATYEKVLAVGVESPAVHFNLGNAYFKAGDVGHAVLAYERALRLAPGDPDLAANVAYARELASDVAEEPLAARLLVPLAWRASTDTLLLAAAACWWALWSTLVIASLLPGVERAPRAIVALALALVGLVVTASSAGYRWWTIEHPTYAVVVPRDDATVRYEPNSNAKAHFAAKPGTVLRVDAEQKGWSQVVGRDHRRGWIETSALEVI